MVCLLKHDPENRKNIKELAEIVGSKEAAYYLLCANNGFPLNLTPQGEDSTLYSALSSLFQGDKKKIIMAKAQAYLPEMVDWVDNPDTTNLQLDKQGEPSIKYLVDSDNGPLFTSTTWNSEDISQILNDEGKLNLTLELLRNNNIINREVPIQNAIRELRNKFVENYIAELSKYEQLTQVGKYLHSMDARNTWDTHKKEELITLIQNRLAKVWDLKIVNKDGDVYFEGDDNSVTGKLRIKFVNSIEDYLDAYAHEKGAYDEDLFRQLSTLYISLEDGDHTTIVHELAHRYIRNYWETLPVQDALKVVQSKKDSSSIDVEEKLVNKLVKALKEDANLSNKFWKGINKLLSKVFSVYSNKQEILDDLVGYFAINLDIQDMQAETVYLAKIYAPVFQSGATKKESDLLDDIRRAIDVRIKAFVHDPVRSNKTLAELRSLDIDLQILDSKNQDDVTKGITYILAECENELRNSVSSIMAQAELQGLDQLDISQFAKLKTNTLGYYNNLINDKINKIFKRQNSNADLSIGSNLYNRFIHVSSLLNMYLLAYERIADRWVDWYIDTIADEIVDFTDKEIWKVNAKHWVRNEINDEGLGQFDKLFTSAGYLFGNINSNSIIANIVDHLVRRANNKIRPIAESVGHHLTSLFDSYTNHVDVLPFNKFRDFCELSYKRDKNGKRGLTGNFRRSENWGEMLSAINKEKKRIAKELDIELDENLRFDWRSIDRDKYNAYYDALDDFYEKNDIVRKFKPEYYRLLRKYMSPETIETRKEILEQIDIIESGCKNQKTGIIETFRLTDEERAKLKDLRKQKKDLANPYNIVLDEDGKFISIELKDIESVEYQMAEEIIYFNDAVKGKIKFIPDWDKYNSDLQALKDSGAKDWQINMWLQDNTIRKIRSGIFESGGFRGNEIAMLYAQKNAIIEATKNTPGHWDPNLSKLNDEAWLELKEIDQAIEDYEKEEGYTKPKGAVNPDAEVYKSQVYHYDDNGVLDTNLTEYLYLLNKYHMASQVNPQAMSDFQEKYHYMRKEKDDFGNTIFIETPLTAFNMTRVGLVSIGDELLEGEVDEPVGHYLKLDKSSSLVEEGYDDAQPAYILPKKGGKWHDAEFEKLYYDKNGKKTKYAEVYDAMIQAMGEIYSNYGMNDINKYLLPGIRDDFSHSMHRRGYFFNGGIKQALTINESDVNYNELTSMRPDGSEIYVVPIRWINKLDNPNLTSTDLISTITAMYEASLNYKEKNEIIPIIEMLLIPMGLDFFGTREAELPAQLQMIRSFIQQNVFGRKRTSKRFHKLNKAADVIMKKTHSKLMAHNWKVIIKNAYDSFWNFNKEMAGGKYFTPKDSIAADMRLAKEIFLNLFRNIGIANVRTLTGAILNRNGINGSVAELFKGQRSTGLRRFFAKHFNMGEYSLIDYTFKGNIALSIYHNHRYIENPLTHKKQFMNKWQAAYIYGKAGLTEKAGVKAWSKAGNIFTGTTLLDAYYVDKEGNLTLKDEYLDAVRPEIRGRRSNLLETRIETVIRERCAVINGILDEMDRPAMMLHALGAMVGQMRGWMFSQSADNFKTGTQLRVLEEDLDKLGFEANEGKSYYESDEYKGAIVNISTGFVEAGAQRHLTTSYCRCILGLFKLYKITNRVKKPTRQDKYRSNMMTVSILSMAITIALSVIFGKMVEDDPDKWFPTFAYAIIAGAMSERVSQLPYGVFISMLELIRSPFVATALYLDAGSVIDVIKDAYEYYRYLKGYENDPSFDDEIKRGGYSANLPILDVPMKNWMRDIMKASSVLFPNYSINNIFKNLSNSSNTSSANFYLDLFPVNIFAYRPDRGRGRSKSNWVTDMFSGNVTRIFNNEGNPYNED